MKRFVTVSLMVLLLSAVSFAQNNRYMVFEFIKVESGQTFDFLEYKDFLGKVYAQAAADGDIEGWDFWSIQQSLNNEGFQYATITYYDDPVKMMNGLSMEKLIELGKEAFPEMGENNIAKKIKESLSIRDLAMISYMVEIAESREELQMKPGMLASFDLMKAVEGRFDEYEKAEEEIFLPLHEKKINAGFMVGWRLLRTAFPAGSEGRSTHMTLNFYSNYMQFFNSLEYEDNASESEQEAIDIAFSARDQKWIYLATLESVVR